MLVKRAGVSTVLLAASVVVILLVIAGAAYYLLFVGRATPGSSSTREITLSFQNPLQLKSGGSSFVNPIMQTWIFEFQNLTQGQVTIDYEPLGSGAGISGIFSGLYDYAGTDAPVSGAAIQANASGKHLLQIPEALGAVAIFYNIPGVHVSLNMTGSVLEQIYLQNITRWNDPAIAGLNPHVSLPNQIIVPVHRSDGSGTTFALTTYFTKIDPSWRSKVGLGTLVNWPNTPNAELAAKGSGGVAALVNQTADSIGYADSFYATANGLTTAAIKNSVGEYVHPNIAGVSAAAAAFGSQVQSNATFSITNAPGSGSYPISTFTYVLVWAGQSDPDKADAISQFLWWVVHRGQTYSPRLFYASLPASVVTIDEGLIKQINYNGQTYIS